MRFSLLTIFLFSATFASADQLAVGRYTRIVISAPSAPLSIPVLSKFVAPRTVGDAVQLILARTGYQLAAQRNTDPMQSTLLAMTLPDAHRDLSALPSLDALVVLGAPGYRVMVDHVHRLIGFEVRPRFWRYQAGDASNHLSGQLTEKPAHSAWQCHGAAGAYRCVARVAS
jgi:conjugative transfer region protein (TIGR03748 family)